MKPLQKLLLALLVLFSFACSTVPAGHVGVKVYLLGGNKGVDSEVLGLGRYWIGWNEELYLFPTFQQNYKWERPADKDAPDESISFQTREGMEVNADVGISYSLDPAKISDVFQKYRRGIDEITDMFLRNHVRDAMTSVGSKLPVESVYGEGKVEFLDQVQAQVRGEVEPIGIRVESLYLLGTMRLPAAVVGALNGKLEATQKAQQRENEVREAEAQAKKAFAEAEGKAKSIVEVAKAEAEANRVVAQSITPELVTYEQIKKWNGAMPTTVLGSGANTLFNVK